MLSLVLMSTAAAVEPAELVGTWNVSMTANYSTCEGVKKGDSTAQQWMVSSRSDSLVVSVVNKEVKYVGVVEGDRVGFVSKTDDLYITVHLDQAEGKLAGRMVVAASTPCAIIQDVEMVKQ